MKEKLCTKSLRKEKFIVSLKFFLLVFRVKFNNIKKVTLVFTKDII